jgi:carboxypeptidase T
VPEILPTFLYAGKAARRPYQASKGPDSTDLAVRTSEDGSLTLTATADATRYADGNLISDGLTEGLDLPNLEDIAGARYSFDQPFWIEGTATYSFTATDGSFDSTVERLTADLDITGLAPGQHILFVESLDAAGNYGVPSALFFEVPGSTSPADLGGLTDSLEAEALGTGKLGRDEAVLAQLKGLAGAELTSL